MKVKKIMSALILGAMCMLPLAACDSTKKDSDNPGGTTDTPVTPVTYPYMDYMEQKVYAAYARPWSSFQTAVAEDTIDKAVAGTATFNNVVYDEIVFKVKTGTNIKNVSFDIVTEKDCRIELFVRCYSPDSGDDVACLYGGDTNKIMPNLSSGVSQRFTIETTKTFKGVTEDAGRYPVGIESKWQYISIGYHVWKGQNVTGSYFYNGTEVKNEGFNIKINKVAFDIEKL